MAKIYQRIDRCSLSSFVIIMFVLQGDRDKNKIKNDLLYEIFISGGSRILEGGGGDHPHRPPKSATDLYSFWSLI